MLHDHPHFALGRCIVGAGHSSQDTKGRGRERSIGHSLVRIEQLERARATDGAMRFDERGNIVAATLVGFSPQRLEEPVGAQGVEEGHDRPKRGKALGFLRGGPQFGHVEVLGGVAQGLDVDRLDSLFGDHLLGQDENRLRLAHVTSIELRNRGVDHFAKALRDLLGVLAEGDDLAHGAEPLPPRHGSGGNIERAPTRQASSDRIEHVLRGRIDAHPLECGEGRIEFRASRRLMGRDAHKLRGHFIPACARGFVSQLVEEHLHPASHRRLHVGRAHQCRRRIRGLELNEGGEDLDESRPIEGGAVVQDFPAVVVQERAELRPRHEVEFPHQRDLPSGVKDPVRNHGAGVGRVGLSHPVHGRLDQRRSRVAQQNPELFLDHEGRNVVGEIALELVGGHGVFG